RTDAIAPGDIAGGGHDAAMTTADDHRRPGNSRIVALFDRRIEGIAVHVGDTQPLELRVAERARRSARAASGVSCAREIFGKDTAVAAQALHRCGSIGQSRAAPRTPLESP